MPTKANIVVCGAGIAGLATAYQLVVQHDIKAVVLVDDKKPLSLTSAYGTEAYRSWWHDPDMFKFIGRSIDLMEELTTESQNATQMNQRGYVFLTANRNYITTLKKQAKEFEKLGGGDLRIHQHDLSYKTAQPEGLEPNLSGTDLILDTHTIRNLYPFLSTDTVAMLHVRRCGWIDLPSMARWMLKRIIAKGGILIHDHITGVNTSGNKVNGARLKSGSLIEAGKIIFATGPLIQQLENILGINPPVFMELHAKVVVRDQAGILPSTVPMMFWTDPINLTQHNEEIHQISRSPETNLFAEPFPGGIHIRPRLEGSKHTFLGLWTYDIKPVKPKFPPEFNPSYSKIVMRGLARMIPGIKLYLDRSPDMVVNGGYYCKTPDNKPLIGPLPVDGTYIVGALSGYGVMASLAAGELITKHITGSPLPDYSTAFLYNRYTATGYVDIENNQATRGQL